MAKKKRICLGYGGRKCKVSLEGQHYNRKRCCDCAKRPGRSRELGRKIYMREYHREYYKNPERREKILEYYRKWRAANPEKAREKHRKWCAANPERVREGHRKWSAANTEKVREKNRKWRAANPEKIREKNRKWDSVRQMARFNLRNSKLIKELFA
jgi:hypothetical protein